ncbi:ATP-binding cassette domain-containing protein [Streptomyces sp. NPDC001480]|uniref:ATP-binding cassette domain-containing protein n=1 Tax=Streptomyces sp. NPDC001480 TaxID=3364577 RepID=UPI003691D9F5
MRALGLLRWRVLARLAGWSVLEAGQTFLVGWALARALDEGFLAGRARAGLLWLGVAALGVALGAYGTGRVYGAVAALVEPVRDRLVERVVARGVREADGAALSGLTQQVEIARDTLAGLVMVSRSFVFTAAGALAGLFSLSPRLLLVVAPPLIAGVGLFAATLRPLARRQEAFLVADEALAEQWGTVCPGLRDVTAAGAETQTGADLRAGVDAELLAARSLARFGVLRVASLALGGQLPVVLLLATAPWLLAHDVTPGALVGALAYVTQSLLPALQNLVHGLGTSGSRLTVVLRRLVPPGEAQDRPAARPPTPGGPWTTGPAAGAGPAGTFAGGSEAGELPPGTPKTEPQGLDARAADAGTGAAHHCSGAADSRLSGPHARPAGTPARPPGGGAGAAGATVGRGGGHARPVGTYGQPAPPAGPIASPDALALASVTFAYGPASEPVIDGLDLRVPDGGHLAVVGPSGIGKSTLTALAAGLLAPGGGAIRVYGRPVPSEEATARRVLIPQEAYVHTGTLAENLGHFRAGPVPEEELLAAADAVGLTPVLESLGGPRAPVEPASLSAGERQLIALTRAYLSRAPLALLDEATCHLDPEAEARAERAFAERPGGTLVVVAHRISSARRADRILVMDGRRTAYGTHDELLAASPLYRDLVGGWTPASAAGPSQPALPL